MNLWRRPSLHVQLLLLVLLAVVPTLVVITYIISQALQARIIELKETGLRFCRLQAAYQERIVGDAQEMLTVLAGLTCWREGDSEYCREQLRALQAKRPAYHNLTVIDPSGHIRCAADPLPAWVNVAGEPWFKQVLATREFTVSGCFTGPASPRPRVIFCYPVIDAASNIEAVVCASLELEVAQQYLSRIPLPEGLFLVALDHTGTVIACSPPSLYRLCERMPLPGLMEATRDDHEGVAEVTDADGVRRIYAFAPVGSKPVAWMVCIGVRRDVALASIHRRFAKGLIAIGVATVLALLAARVFATRHILRPVSAVVNAARQLAAGELTTRVHVADAAGEIAELAAAFNDMAASLEQHTAERQHAEEQLQRSERAFRSLAMRLQAIREEESTRIAREMHDQLGQALSSLKLDLSWVEMRLENLGEGEHMNALREMVGSMSGQIDATIQSVQKLSGELRPGVLDELGLTSAIEWQAQEFQRRSGVKTRAAMPEAAVTLDRDRSTALFRILQEALTNVLRHAEATEVSIGFRQDGVGVTLEVVDNGRGITPEQIADPKSLGLLSMRERAVAVGGAVVITGDTGRGTKVIVRMPR